MKTLRVIVACVAVLGAMSVAGCASKAPPAPVVTKG